MRPQFEHLHSQIHKALAAHRRGILLRGISLLLLAAAGGFGLLLLAGRFSTTLPFMRWLALGVGLAFVGIALVRYLLRPLRNLPTTQQVARRIEELHPDLEDRLATAVEFGDRGPASDAEDLVRRLLNETVMQTAHLNFARQVEVPYAGMWRVLAAVLAVAMLAAVGFYRPLSQRLKPLLVQETNADLLSASLKVTPGNADVRRGSNVVVEAQAGELPASATLYLSSGDTSWSAMPMLAATEAGKYSYEVFEVNDTLRYYVRAGKELSPIFRLSPADVPALRSIRLTYRYPGALGVPPRQTAGSGDIHAPAGTSVGIRAGFSQSLNEASIQVGEQAARPGRIEADTLLVADLQVTSDTVYRLMVAGRNGLAAEPLEFFIRVRPDEPPAITLRRPGRDARITMLEEVPIEVGVAEDYGLKRLELVFTVDDGKPQRQELLSQARRQSAPAGEDESFARPEYRSRAMLYLEELKVEPGDFISYYVEAADQQHTAGSDIYFLEVRPFEEEFAMAVSQSSGGGMAPNTLSISEKEIIVATHKLNRDRSKYAQNELQDRSRAIAEAQRGVREMIDHARSMMATQDAEGHAAEYLEKAIEAMRRAEPELEATRLEEALSPEREAYNFLLKAEVEVRRRELSSGNSGSGAVAQSQEDLQRLFADELDKIQSKYETLQNAERRSVQEQISEALEKVRELAQRQEQLNDMNRELSRQQLAETERRRQIARLRREQEELNRQTGELARRLQRLDRQSERESSRPEESLQQAADDMSRASSQLNRDNPQNAVAEGRRAVDRLEQAEEQLRRSASQSLQQQLTELRDDFRRLSRAQRQLADSVATGSAQASEDRRQRWTESQRDLHERLGDALRQLESAERRAGADNPQAARELRDLVQRMTRANAEQEMAEAAQGIAENRLGDAERHQRQAQRALEQADAGLGRAQPLLAKNNEDRLDEALRQAQNLRRDLENEMQQRRDSTRPENSQGGGNPLGGTKGSNSEEYLRPEDLQRWRERIWQSRDQLEAMRSALKGDTSLVDDYTNLQRQFSGVVRSFTGGDPQRLSDIETKLLDPLRRFEAELATRLAFIRQRQRLATAQDEQVPPEYREQVERYYEALARAKGTRIEERR